jgi:hypothetical protein
MSDNQSGSCALPEPDGLHLKTKGYVHMWQKARAATGIEVASADLTPEVTGTVPLRTAGKKAERIPLPVPRRPLASGAR